jgi:hypothetical protein
LLTFGKQKTHDMKNTQTLGTPLSRKEKVNVRGAVAMGACTYNFGCTGGGATSCSSAVGDCENLYCLKGSSLPVKIGVCCDKVEYGCQIVIDCLGGTTKCGK